MERQESDPELMLQAGAPRAALAACAAHAGIMTLARAAQRRAEEGLTTWEEARRVAGALGA